MRALGLAIATALTLVAGSAAADDTVPTKREVQQNPGPGRMVGRIGGSLSGPRLTPQRATTFLVEPNVKSQPLGWRPPEARRLDDRAPVQWRTS